jgi:Spy/CpxP family protein refolding chaperone
LTTAAVVALSSTLAFAAPRGDNNGARGEGHRGGHHRGEGGGEFGVRFAQKLNLSEAQKQQIKDLQQNFRETNKAFFQATRETRKQMHDAKEAGDTAKFESLKATGESQRSQMKSLRDAQMARIEAILTPEQRTQWQALKAEHEARKAERGQRFGKRNNDK